MTIENPQMVTAVIAVIAFLINLATQISQYGRLTAKVDSLREDVNFMKDRMFPK